VLRVRRTEMVGDKLSTLFEVTGTLSVIRTTNGQFPHKRLLEVTPLLAPNRLLAAAELSLIFLILFLMLHIQDDIKLFVI